MSDFFFLRLFLPEGFFSEVDPLSAAELSLAEAASFLFFFFFFLLVDVVWSSDDFA